ncbi:MAG: protoheme IX farnesyltransferase, partial [Actinomycetota bacterium]|nr:protoheme IX farnesyltransferase [Actinomycetota bacterium]
LLLAPHYEAAQVPMLPVVRGTSATTRQVLGYTVLLTVVTVVPFVTGTFGAVYLVAAIGLGGGFCGLAVRMWRAPQARRAALLFHYSLLYLALLFVAVALDAAAR